MREWATEDPTVDAENGASRRAFFWDDELSTLSPREWLVPGVLPLDADCRLFGDWGAGKTFAALHLAGCLATGTPFAGIPVTRSLVVYVAGEGFAGLPDRWRGWTRRHGIEGRAGVLFFRHPVNLLRGDDVAAFVGDLRAVLPTEIDRPLFFTFDTQARCTEGGDDRRGQDSGAMLANLARLRAEFAGRCSTLLLHHPGHGDKERGRSHSSEDQALDAIFKIEKAGPGLNQPVTIRLRKEKDGDDSRVLHFRLASVRLNDERITGAIEDADAPTPEEAPKHPRLQDRAHNALAALANAPGQCASYTTWETAAAGPPWSVKGKTFERAKGDLLTSGHVLHTGTLYEPSDIGVDYCEAHKLTRQPGAEG